VTARDHRTLTASLKRSRQFPRDERVVREIT
jgi:hypothetical protein